MAGFTRKKWRKIQSNKSNTSDSDNSVIRLDSGVNIENRYYIAQKEVFFMKSSKIATHSPKTALKITAQTSFLSALTVLKTARHAMADPVIQVLDHIAYWRAEDAFLSLYCEKRNKKEALLHDKQRLSAKGGHDAH